MPALSAESLDRLAFLRGRLAVLREEYVVAERDYLEGRLSLTDEITQLTHLNHQVYTIVAEVVGITSHAAE